MTEILWLNMWGGKHLSGIRDRDFCSFYPHKSTSTWRFFSHTRSGFPLFLPIWEISISHTRTSPREKRTSSRRPHIIPWRHCNVKMSANSGFSGSLFYGFQYKMRYIQCATRDHRLSSLGKPRDANRWSPRQIFLSHPYTHHSYNLTNPALENEKTNSRMLAVRRSVTSLWS